ncbi:MAG: molybdopterin molybdotransferase MoeA [Janthinobacterium lividum]
MAERVLSFEDALAEVLQHADTVEARPAAIRVPLLEAFGRVLAQAVVAERDQPPFARSTRDGFAVRAADLPEGGLHVVGTVRAGEQWIGDPLQDGETIEIMTGAPVPAGADAVLMVEHGTFAEDNTLGAEEGRSLKSGENVVPRGAEARAGVELVPAGRVLGVAEIAVAASCGYADVEVFPEPRVAILATGDELVELDGTPEDWQIRNSNSYALAALVTAEGGEAVRLPIAQDTREDLRRRITEGRRADLLLLSGGVSMGKFDLVEEVLDGAGAEFLFTGTKIQPGRPLVFGRLPRADDGWTYFFGLPGNPISTEVCFRLFVTPLLRALCGRTERAPRFSEAKLVDDVPGGARVTRFLPAEITGDWQGVHVRPVPWQGSGDLAANARANGFMVLPIGTEQFAAGETVRVLLR